MIIPFFIYLIKHEKFNTFLDQLCRHLVHICEFWRDWLAIHTGTLLHSGLNLAWHFWFINKIFFCLKMKSVENILGYIREQFYRFSRGCKPQENLWNCSRKYTKMFKTDSFLDNKKLSFNQNVWRDHATMQQDVLLHFWVIFLSILENEKNILLSSSRAFSLSTPMENSAVCQL